MDLFETGRRLRGRRIELGLSQDRLARLAGLSRATVNQLETGSLEDLGVAKLAALLDLVGLRLDTHRGARRRGLRAASRTASVSYRTTLAPTQLAHALASGSLPEALTPHIATLIDEAPLSLLVAAVEEAARETNVPPQRIWRHLVRWAAELRSPRHAWT